MQYVYYASSHRDVPMPAMLGPLCNPIYNAVNVFFRISHGGTIYQIKIVAMIKVIHT